MDANNIPPEVMAQLLRQGGLEKKGSLIQQQLDALHAPSAEGPEHSTGLGAALGGLGGIVKDTRKYFKAEDLEKEREANLASQNQGREAAGEAYADANDPARMERASQLHGLSDLLRSSPQVEPGATSPDQWVSGPNGNWVNGAMSPPLATTVSSGPMPQAQSRRMPKFAQPISPFDF